MICQKSPSNLSAHLLESPPSCMFPLTHHFTHSGIFTSHVIGCSGTASTKRKEAPTMKKNIYIFLWLLLGLDIKQNRDICGVVLDFFFFSCGSCQCCCCCFFFYFFLLHIRHVRHDKSASPPEQIYAGLGVPAS